MVIRGPPGGLPECPADYYGLRTNVEILRSEATAIQNLRPLDMKIESSGPRVEKKMPLRGNQKSIDSTIFHIDEQPRLLQNAASYKNKGA